MILMDRQMRFAIASIFSIFVFFGTPPITLALSCGTRLFTLSEAYEEADSIVVGLITECKEEISSDPWAHGGSDCSFISLEVLKESMPARDYSGVTSSSGCGLSLHVGAQYLLFLDSKNQPMHYSAALSGDQYPAQLSSHYLRIIRDYKNGAIDDLAEPWMLRELEGACSLSHRVGGNQITFTRRQADSPPQPKPDWTQETINGKTVHRSSVPLSSADSTSPFGVADIVAYGDIPDYPDDVLMMNVDVPERSPSPVRQATLSVGARTWSLNRVEINLSFRGSSAHTMINYHAAGEVAEQILSAMTQPSDIIVSATLVASKIESNPPPEFTQPGQRAVTPTPPNDAYFGPGVPETSLTRPAVTPSVRAAGSYGAQKEPPQLVLRLESRSTQLSGEIKSFRACYEGNEK